MPNIRGIAMSTKQKLKIAVDILMTAALLLLMPYALIGEAAHEWIGMGMLVLFVLHHILNHRWIKNLGRGKYTCIRAVQTVLVALILISILGSMASGILLSRYVFAFLDIRGLTVLARSIHMFCAYWGFVLMALHLGLHWGMVTGLTGKWFKSPSASRTLFARGISLAIAVYGIRAFMARGIPGYLLMQVHFVFFNYEEPVIFFILDYMAVMGLFVFVGHYFGRVLRNRKKKEKK